MSEQTITMTVAYGNKISALNYTIITTKYK